MIPGMGPDSPVVENEKGGKQSALPYAFHLIDAPSIFKLAERLAYGASRYSRDNWRKIPAEEHFNHATAHGYAYLSGDRQDDHLGGYICRAMMFVACAIAEAQAEKSDAGQAFPINQASKEDEKAALERSLRNFEKLKAKREAEARGDEAKSFHALMRNRGLSCSADCNH